MASQVVPGVVQLGLGISNAYLVDTGDGLVVVDTGTPGHAEAIRAGIRGMGRTERDVRAIVLTHQHADHAGSVGVLARETGIPVLVHALDAATVREGGVPTTGGPRGRIPRLLMRFSPTARLEAAPVARELVDGDDLGAATGLRVIHAPGHTPGHIALHWSGAGGVLFAGDAASNILGRLGRAIVAADWAAADASVARLAELSFETAVFGHGRIIQGAAAARFRRFADEVARTGR